MRGLLWSTLHHDHSNYTLHVKKSIGVCLALFLRCVDNKRSMSRNLGSKVKKY